MLLLIGLQNSNRAILSKEHLFYAKFEWKLINSNLFYNGTRINFWTRCGWLLENWWGQITLWFLRTGRFHDFSLLSQTTPLTFHCGFPQTCGHGTVWAQDGSSVMKIFVNSLGLWRRWTHRILVWQRQLHPCYSFRLGRELLRGMVAQSGLHFRAGLPLMWSYLTNCQNEIWVMWYELLLECGFTQTFPPAACKLSAGASVPILGNACSWLGI